MTSQNFKSWTVLHFLEHSSPLDISMVLVFGSGKEALITTKDLKTYGLGANQHGCLGIGTNDNAIEPTEIVELRGLSIKTFACGSGPHVLALADDGTVHTWGRNDVGQLGNPLVASSNTPLFSEELKTAGFIKDIGCGPKRSVALTDKGMVYITDLAQQYNFAKWVLVNHSPIKNFSSGDNADILVLESNKVLVKWPSKPNPGNEFLCKYYIEKVVSGRNHTLALTSTMDVLSLGSNKYGQLGRQIQSSEPDCELHKVVFPVPARILDIAATYCENISIALDINNKVFIWGLCGGHIIYVPRVVQVSNLHNTMAIFGEAKCMHAPLRLCVAGDNADTNLLESIKLSFDDPQSCDLVIEVEGKDINVHANILKMRSPYFQSMLKEPWTNCGEGVKVDGYSYNTYRSLLWYLHTDECVVSTVMEACLLYEAADIHILPVLKYRCACIFKSQLDILNVLKICTVASEKKLTELLDACVEFMLSNMTAVAEAPGFNELPDDFVKQLFTNAATKNILLT